MTFDLHHGDCLEVMAGLPSASFDAVICDPPYMVGAVSVGNAKAKAGTWADMENSAYWFSAWMAQAKRLLKPTGYMVVFGNWRSIPTLIRALSLCDMPASSCMVWDKEWIGPAGPQQLRGRYEVVMFSAMPEGRIDDRAAPDVFSCKWMAGNMKTTKHPAEKPVVLLRRLIELVTPVGGSVLDPFNGSGSTGVASVELGRSYVGIEREAEYVAIASERIAAAQMKQAA